MVDQQDPKSVGDVYNCMSAVGWSRSFIPNFAVLEQPVRSFVMRHLGTGRKTRRRADNIPLAKCDDWDDSMRANFARLRLSVVNSVKRAYRDYTKVSCLFWDASKFAWSYTITQCAPEELAKPWDKQEHQILVTRSGLFKGSQLRWHRMQRSVPRLEGDAEGCAVPTRQIPVDCGRGPPQYNLRAATAKAPGQPRQG